MSSQCPSETPSVRWRERRGWDELDQRTGYDDVPEIRVDEEVAAAEVGIGATVSHDSFGTGRVLETRGTGRDLKLLINFEAHGLKNRPSPLPQRRLKGSTSLVAIAIAIANYSGIGPVTMTKFVRAPLRKTTTSIERPHASCGDQAGEVAVGNFAAVEFDDDVAADDSGGIAWASVDDVGDQCTRLSELEFCRTIESNFSNVDSDPRLAAPCRFLEALEE